VTFYGRVLVVEDDPDLRQALRTVLESESYEILVAEHGEDALAQIVDITPDVILLDMRMPRMDGWAFADRYRQMPGPHAPIIVISAAADAARNATEIGAAGYVPKPFEIARLLAAIDRCGVAPGAWGQTTDSVPGA
jgi:CheY-like chemotaxis protein